MVVSQYFCSFVAKPVLYLFLFFHLQLVNCILDNIPYPMPKILITFQTFCNFRQCFRERFPIAGGSEQAVYCSVLCFSYVEGVHSYHSSEQFQYLMVVDTMSKKLSPPVVC